MRSPRRMPIGNQRDATAKDLPLETRIQFPHLHANALKFGACGARRQVRVACGYVGARDQNGCDLPLPRSTLELRAPEVIGGKARAGECFNFQPRLPTGRRAERSFRFSIPKISILFQATTSRPAWAGAGFRWTPRGRGAADRGSA